VQIYEKKEPKSSLFNFQNPVTLLYKGTVARKSTLFRKNDHENANINIYIYNKRQTLLRRI